MRLYWLVLGILAVWRIAHFFNAEDGPWDFAARLRVLAGNGFFGGLLDCFYCLSLWVALPVAVQIGETATEKSLLWPALSGGAILLQHASHRDPPTAHYEEDKTGE
jgi:hypothetical protein